MLKQIGSFTGTRSTTTSALNITTKVKHNSFGGRKTLKYLLLQQLFAKAKGTKKHAKWTGRKQLRKNCGKFRKIAKLRKIAKKIVDPNPPPLWGGPRASKLACQPTLRNRGWLSRCGAAGTAVKEEEKEGLAVGPSGGRGTRTAASQYDPEGCATVLGVVGGGGDPPPPLVDPNLGGQRVGRSAAGLRGGGGVGGYPNIHTSK